MLKGGLFIKDDYIEMHLEITAHPWTEEDGWLGCNLLAKTDDNLQKAINYMVEQGWEVWITDPSHRAYLIIRASEVLTNDKHRKIEKRDNSIA